MEHLIGNQNEVEEKITGEEGCITIVRLRDVRELTDFEKKRFLYLFQRGVYSQVRIIDGAGYEHIGSPVTGAGGRLVIMPLWDGINRCERTDIPVMNFNYREGAFPMTANIKLSELLEINKVEGGKKWTDQKVRRQISPSIYSIVKTEGNVNGL